MKPVIHVLEEDKHKVPSIIKNFAEAINILNKKGHLSSRISITYDVNFNVVLINHQGTWVIESIRSSEQALKRAFKKQNNLLEDDNA